ncbi:cation-translocating P-type ATPase [Luteimicrobium subarcticum]|uniref:Potassium/sodium efflux P-type ATPase n=1 Tax=Luteimicrobium subarcticum TaxID=620910 RepID=A0A2M8WS09_9MICO|nr:potassium/sodium efflux P-type ATPase [Luteimicrobium subarcticum]
MTPTPARSAPASDTPAPDAPWASAPADALAAVGSSPDGLTGAEASRRLGETGRNELPPPERPPLWRRILSHFQDVLIYVLLVAAALEAMLGGWVDFFVILLVAVVNAAIGFIQEGRAESALDSIRQMLSTSAEVRRDGAWARVDAAELVPGDVVRVRAGDRVPADLRLLDATNLRVEESALTGESVPASKDADAEVDAEAGVGDRSTMLFSGTIVAAGAGSGVVVRTGAATEIGRIQSLVESAEALDTPLTRQLARFGAQIALLILVLGLVMAVVGHVVHRWEPADLISASIGFAVAAVPEGLPALVTITLALGVQQMARRRAITRKLPAVETLGSVSTVCSDKTGTLTQNEMTARTVRTAARTYAVSGVGYAPDGVVSAVDDGTAASLDAHPALAALVETMALCNDARVVPDETLGWVLVGEPTEGALRTLGLKAGVTTAGWVRRAVVPFDSAVKYMATLDVRGGVGAVLHVKGAPDRVLGRCTAQLGEDGRPEPLDVAFWEAQVDALGAQGLRVLAAARRDASSERSRRAAGTTDPMDTVTDDDLVDLVLVGVVGIVDPPRPEAVAAIADCHAAGIGVKMITGDHAGTAAAIGKELGILDAEGRPAGPGGTGDPDAPGVLTGPELESMSTEQLKAVVRDVDVYARTSPEHKIRIVSALQAHGQVVAMTGDGVNDAPALTQADVGVAMGIKGTEATKEAMGIKGTEATKEAAEVVLADDNFATIERAVEEGRRIYDNVRKSVLFLLPTNGAQALVIFVAVLFGWTLPLEPVQVLWINMVTAVTLSLALAYEGPEAGIMRRPPRDPRATLVDRASLRRVLLVSALIGGAALLVFYVEREGHMTVDQAQTTAVTTLALGQLAYLFSCRFLDRSSLTWDVLRGNRVLWVSAGSLVVLQVLFVYVPFMHTLFGSASVGWRGWWVPLLLAVAVFLVVELLKALDRRAAR